MSKNASSIVRKRKQKPQIIAYIVIILLTFVFLYPFWHTAVLSVSDKISANELGFKFWPKGWSLDAYKNVFTNDNIWIAYGNTIWRTIVGTIITLALTYTAAYAMSHKDAIPGWSAINFFIMFTMFFGGGLIPTYLNLKALGLVNTRWVLVLPGACGAYNFAVMRSFVKGISKEMEEAARIDGATVLQTMVRIYLPLSKPTLAVIGLWSAVGHWNAWFDAMVYANKDEFTVLQTIVRRLTEQANDLTEKGNDASLAEITPQTVRAATVMITTVPILMGYPFIQKYLVKGTMVGAVKG